MKLFEIKTITPKDFEPKRVGNPKGSYTHLIPKNSEELGFGSYGTVFTTKDEPGTITKIVRNATNLKSDQYFKYVSALAKNDRISRNPYFPKIYSIKIEKDRSGMSRYSVDMESLLNFDSLSIEEMYMLGEKMFFNFYAFAKDARARIQDVLGMKDAKMQSKKTASFAIMKAMERVIVYGAKVETYIKDPNLKGALLILKSLVNKHEASPDIHSGNIMVRRGPGGPQLVITDPVV